MPNERAFVGRTVRVLTIPVLNALTLNLYLWFWLYRRYSEIRRTDPTTTSLTPGRALGFLFIPVFNVFWYFYVTYDFARALRRLQGKQTGRALVWPYSFSVLMIGSLVIGAPLLVAVSARQWWTEAMILGGVNTLALWCAMVIAQVSLNRVWYLATAPGAANAVGPPDPVWRFYRRQLLVSLLCAMALSLALVALTHAVLRLGLSLPGTASRIGLSLPGESDSPASQEEIEKSLVGYRVVLDQAGVDSPVVERSRVPTERIAILLPPYLPRSFDSARIRALLNARSGLLELREVVAGPFMSESDAQAALSSDLASKLEVLQTESHQQYLVCQKEAVVTGRDVGYARAQQDALGNPSVYANLTSQAGERMRAYSRSHAGTLLAIVLNGKVLSTPTIHGEIGRDIQITGGFNPTQAEDLALVLGAVPLPFQVVSEEIVPSGHWVRKYAIRAGVLALIFLMIVGGMYRFLPARP